MKIEQKKGSNVFRNLCLTIYFTYMLDPFFINSIAMINRLIYYIVAILPVVYTILRNQKPVLDRAERNILYCILLIVCWALIMSGVVADDLYFFSDMIKLLFKVVAGMGLVLIWKKGVSSKKITWSYEKIFVYAITIYIFSSLFFLLVPSTREFWVSFIYNDRQPMYILETASYATRYGLAGWSSFGEAYMVLFGELVVIVMYHKKELSKPHFIFLNMIMLIGTFLYGRFALVVVIIILAIWGVYSLIIQKKFWIFNVLIGSIIVGVLLIYFLYNNDSTRVIIEWAMEPIFNYMKKGSFFVNSTAELGNMYKSFNPSTIEILTGVGKWYEKSGLPYKLTDVGFMRNLYFGGIGFCTLLYGTDIFISYKYAISLKCIDSFKKVVILLLIVLIVSADLKGSMTFNFMRYVIPLIMVNKYYKRKENGK